MFSGHSVAEMTMKQMGPQNSHWLAKCWVTPPAKDCSSKFGDWGRQVENYVQQSSRHS